LSHCSHYQHRVEDTSLPITDHFLYVFFISNILSMFYLEQLCNYSVRVSQKPGGRGSNIFSHFFHHHRREEDPLIHICTEFFSICLGPSLIKFYCEMSLHYRVRVPQSCRDGGLNIFSPLFDQHHHQDDPLIPIKSICFLWYGTHT